MSSGHGLRSPSPRGPVVGPDQRGPDHVPDELGRPELDAIYQLSVRTADATGEEFFDALVRQLVEVLDMRAAFVSLFTEDLCQMRILAMWDGERYIKDRVYEMALTPCREVAKGRIFHCPQGVQERFPDDRHLAALGAQSYRGVPLVGPSGWHMGHLAIVGSRALEDEPRCFALMRMFAVRAAAELDRLKASAGLARSERRLSTVLQSTHDGIVHLDEQGGITLFNAAAGRIFGCDSDQIRGQPFVRFVSQALRPTIEAFVRRQGEGTGTAAAEPLWLPAGAVALRTDGTGFRIEGTMTAGRDGDDVAFTLVLRDVDERVASQRRIEQLARDNAVLAEELGREHPVGSIVGSSPAMRAVLRHVEQVAPTDATVLILGESGTGKELVARAIHAASSRRDRPLVRVNCAALPASLIESELFGHEKGSFTGASATRLGRFEVADRGTLFLDEIGELPLPLQPKLLRVLQEQELERVGSSNTRKVDVRIIAATNRDLRVRVERGEFRDDLYYRLMGFPLQLPPLRERTEDIEPLAQVFMQRYARQIGRQVDGIDEAGLRRLVSYPWPGNVRELQSVIERAVILSPGHTLEVAASLAMVPGASPSVAAVEPEPSPARPVMGVAMGVAKGVAEGVAEGEPVTPPDQPPLSLQELERRHIQEVLHRTGGVIDGPRGAARLLEINASTLRSRMRRLGIERSS
ncbi:MAG: sigma 54-interacting transcriptional regulator [Myxococcota bacterium]